MNPWRTEAVTLLSSGETINVLPREIPGLKKAGLISKDVKSKRAAKITPKTDAKLKAQREAAALAEKEKAEKIAAREKAEQEAADKLAEAEALKAEADAEADQGPENLK